MVVEEVISVVASLILVDSVITGLVEASIVEIVESLVSVDSLAPVVVVSIDVLSSVDSIVVDTFCVVSCVDSVIISSVGVLSVLVVVFSVVFSVEGSVVVSGAESVVAISKVVSTASCVIAVIGELKFIDGLFSTVTGVSVAIILELLGMVVEAAISVDEKFETGEFNAIPCSINCGTTQSADLRALLITLSIG